jgi:hypothetical protein
LYSSPNITRQIKSRRMRWARHVARMREKCAKFWWENPKERDHSKDQGVDGSIRSKWTLGRLVGGCGVDSPGSRLGLVAGCCECGDEPSGSGATGLVIKTKTQKDVGAQVPLYWRCFLPKRNMEAKKMLAFARYNTSVETRSPFCQLMTYKCPGKKSITLPPHKRM